MNIEKLFGDIMQTKAQMHLDKARTRSQYIMSDDLKKGMFEENLDREVKYQIRFQYSKQVLEKYNGQITKERVANGTKYDLDLITIPTNIFRECVEELVKQMPDHLIHQIKTRQ